MTTRNITTKLEFDFYACFMSNRLATLPRRLPAFLLLFPYAYVF